MNRSLAFGICYLFSLSLFAAMPEWKQRLMPEDDTWKSTEQHLIFHNESEPETLDPTMMTGVGESRIGEALFEGLTSLDPETLEIRPGVAERWEVSEDGLVYTFHLHKDSKWSDGSPLTARDFVHSWKRALSAETASSYAYQLYPLANAEAFHKGKLKDFSQVGVKVIDDYTLETTLTSPTSYWLDLTAFHTLFPVPVALINQHGDRWVRPEHIICNGPFKMVEWSPREKIVLEKNPHFIDADIVKLKKITILPYDNLDTAYRLYLQGEMHWLNGVPQSKLEEIRRHPDYYVTPYFGTYFYRFNITRPPFEDVRVRKAFSMAINRSLITDTITRSGQQPVTSFCPPVAGYEPVDGIGYNREEARKLAAQSGYGTADKPWPEIEILFNTSEAHKQIAEAIAQMWKETFGVTVSLRNQEWKVYLSEQDNLNFQVCRASWIGDYSDPNTFLDMFVTDGGNNRTGWSSAKHDDLLKQAQAEINSEKRLALYQQIESILVKEETPIAPIYRYVNQGMLNESVYGWYENIRDRHPLQYIWLQD